MKKITFLLASLFIGFGAYAQEATPNTGVNWTLDSLVENLPQAVSFTNNSYTISEDFTVSGNDTLRLLPGNQVRVNSDIQVTVAGKFFSEGEAADSILVTASDSLSPYKGFRFEEEAEVIISYTRLTYGGGLKTITPNFTITHSKLAHNESGITTGGIISLSHGSPLIAHNKFLKNALPAVSSPANGDVSAQILDNEIIKNSQANANRPQINMGTTGEDTLRIVGNTILGDRNLDQVGGIAVANLIGGEVNAIIKNNTVKDNRYGMTVVGGNAYVKIIDNTITDNDTQGLPNLGGSGISVNASANTQTIIATGNTISGNLWGITVINEASINLGDDEGNPGHNVFNDNENGGQVYALYNNTPNTILAKHNCWVADEESGLTPADVIVDQEDDSSLGEVIYTPYGCDNLATPDFGKMNFSIYPNPAKNQIHIEGNKALTHLAIFDSAGRRVFHTSLKKKQTTLALHLDSGLYFIQIESNRQKVIKKLIIR